MAKEAENLTKAELVACAKDLNAVVGLIPSIPTDSKMRTADLKCLILQAGNEVVDPLDPLEDSTWAVLAALGADISEYYEEEY